MAGLTTLSYVKANVSGLDNEVMLGLFLALLLRWSDESSRSPVPPVIFFPLELKEVYSFWSLKYVRGDYDD